MVVLFSLRVYNILSGNIFCWKQTESVAEGKNRKGKHTASANQQIQSWNFTPVLSDLITGNMYKQKRLLVFFSFVPWLGLSSCKAGVYK